MEKEVIKERVESFEVYKDNLYTRNVHGLDESVTVRLIKGQKFASASAQNVGDAERLALQHLAHSPEGSYYFTSQKPRSSRLHDNLVVEKLMEVFESLSAELFNLSAKHVMDVQLSSSLHYFSLTNDHVSFNWATSYFSMVVTLRGNGWSDAVFYSSWRFSPQLDVLREQVRYKVEMHERPAITPPSNLPVVLNYEVAAQFINFFLSFASANKVFSQESDWRKGHVVSEAELNVFIERDGGSGPYAFDDEGNVAPNLTLIDHGVLNFIYSNMEKRALGVDAEHGFGFRAGNVVIDLPSLRFEVNDKEEPERFILIEDCHGLHTANPTTGEFSCSVPFATLHTAEGVKRLKPFTMVGNVLHSFKYVSALNNEYKWVGHVNTAPLILPDVKVVS